MPLVDLKDMLHHAHRNGYAVGAFDLIHPEFVDAIIGGCERARAPVVLSLPKTDLSPFRFELALATSDRAARSATVPVAILFDHGRSFESAVRAMNLGCNGLMVDASDDPYSTHVALARQVAEMAHACGVTVGGRVGSIAIEEVRSYAEQTQVDCLAVSTPPVHGERSGWSKRDLERFAEINQRLNMPLVFDADKRLRDAQYRQLTANGVAMILHATALADDAAAKWLAAVGNSRLSFTQLIKGIGGAVQDEVERLVHLFGAAGRADEAGAIARPWRDIEHLIIYNTDARSDAEVDAMMARGREVLSRIPGVRRVASGRAITAHAKYRCCWIIEFTNAKVISSYRDHPDHVAFADELFRPMAKERISIDYELTEIS